VIVEEVENNIDIIDKNIESENVDEEIVSSVAVRVRRRGGRQ
jgi:RecA/RadA recombinase